MTKPKKKKAQPTFFAHSHRLRSHTKKELLGLLGNNEERAILEVEKALGLGVNAAEHLDDIPRPVDYVATFTTISKGAASLHNSLCELGGYFSDEVTKKGADQDAIEAALIKLLTVAEAIVKDYEGLSSRGARKNNALAEVIRRLRIIFRNNYKGATTGKLHRGAVTFRSKEENQELKFVLAALLDARLVRIGFSGTELRRLFSDSRCAVPAGRAESIERIAKKAAKVRQQKKDD